MPTSLYIMLGGLVAIVITIVILDSLGRPKSRH